MSNIKVHFNADGYLRFELGKITAGNFEHFRQFVNDVNASAARNGMENEFVKLSDFPDLKDDYDGRSITHRLGDDLPGEPFGGYSYADSYGYNDTTLPYVGVNVIGGDVDDYGRGAIAVGTDTKDAAEDLVKQASEIAKKQHLALAGGVLRIGDDNFAVYESGHVRQLVKGDTLAEHLDEYIAANGDPDDIEKWWDKFGDSSIPG